MDKLLVKDLLLRNTLGANAWELQERQPLLLNLTAYFDVGESAKNDLLTASISYAALAKHAQLYTENNHHRTLESLSSGVALALLQDFEIPKVTVSVQKTRGLLHAEAVGIEITRTKEDIPGLIYLLNRASPVSEMPSLVRVAFHQDCIFIKNLALSCIIGVYPWERAEKQRISVNITMHISLDRTVMDDTPKIANYRSVARAVSHYVEKSSFKTVEALVYNICNVLIHQCHIPQVTVRVEKPSAITFAQGAGVEMTRSAETIPRLPVSDLSTTYLAIGSNMGDRLGFLNQALSQLQSVGRVVDTSFLYESAPMYVTDQPRFLNAAIKFETKLTPIELLKALKMIEEQLGRDFQGQRYGPRPIDLDILYYEDIELGLPELIIPHPRIQEREFVLRPLAE